MTERVTYKQFEEAKSIIERFRKQLAEDTAKMREVKQDIVEIKQQEDMAPRIQRYVPNANIKNILSKRLYNVIIRNMTRLGVAKNSKGVMELKELRHIDYEVFLKCRNVGSKTIEEIDAVLETIKNKHSRKDKEEAK